MSLRDVLKSEGKELDELRRLETLLDLDEAEMPRPGFDTRFFARLEETKRGLALPWWRRVRIHLWAPALAAASLVGGVWILGQRAIEPVEPQAQHGAATRPESPTPASRGERALTESAPETPSVTEGSESLERDVELALDLDLAEDLELVGRLDEAEGALLLAELDAAKLEDREVEELLREVAVP